MRFNNQFNIVYIMAGLILILIFLIGFYLGGIYTLHTRDPLISPASESQK